MGMPIFYRNKKISKKLNDLADMLPSVFDNSLFVERLDSLQLSADQEEELAPGVSKIKKPVGIKWSGRAVVDLYSNTDSIRIMDLLEAWTRSKCYLSHFSALYFNNLINQRPMVHYLSMDLHNPRKRDDDFNKLAMIQSFMKSPRITTKKGSYEKNTFYFLEKNRGGIGVRELRILQDDVDYNLRITDIERSLIDAIIAPHYSGGLLTVIAAVRNATIDIAKLKDTYDSLSLTYAYWQRVGFILEVAGHLDTSGEWIKYFGKPEMEFFVDHGFRDSWRINKRWNVRYPQGIE
jgi:hypothetical protein